jgi:hypothetical protein
MPGDQSVSEQRPEGCPRGHAYVDDTGSFVKVGWEPCLCTAGHTGHRTYWCERCGHVLEVPPLPAGTAWHVGDIGYREAELAVPSGLTAGGSGLLQRQDPFVDCAGRVCREARTSSRTREGGRLFTAEVASQAAVIGDCRPENLLARRPRPGDGLCADVRSRR